MRQAAQQTRAAHPSPVSTAGRVASRTRGITLLELLVVMLILLMITAAAIPIIAPAMQNRQMREATRLVTAFIGAAKARAVQTGRPVGIVVERFNGQPYALQMAQVEVPPPYSGDAIGARLKVEELLAGSVSTNAQDHFASLFPGKTPQWFKATEPFAGFLNAKLLKVGDQIQFNGQGPRYVILGPDNVKDGAIEDISAGTPLELVYVYDPPLTQAFPWLNTSPAPQEATYQVFRQPVRTSTPPLLLPEGIVFDLSVSGTGTLLFNSQDYSTNIGAVPSGPVVRYDPQVIFSPSGRVEWATNPGNAQLARPTDSIYFLLGRREWMHDVASRANVKDIVFQNLSPIAPAGQSNVVQTPAENFWVTIRPQSGQVQTAQVAPNLQDYEDLSSNNLTTHIDVIRLALWGVNPAGNVVHPGALSFAREAQSLGGR